MAKKPKKRRLGLKRTKTGLRLCLCGCGKKFHPGRRWQKYLNKRHKDRRRRDIQKKMRIVDAIIMAMAEVLGHLRRLGISLEELENFGKEGGGHGGPEKKNTKAG